MTHDPPDTSARTNLAYPQYPAEEPNPQVDPPSALDAELAAVAAEIEAGAEAEGPHERYSASLERDLALMTRLLALLQRHVPPEELERACATGRHAGEYVELKPYLRDLAFAAHAWDEAEDEAEDVEPPTLRSSFHDLRRAVRRAVGQPGIPVAELRRVLADAECVDPDAIQLDGVEPLTIDGEYLTAGRRLRQLAKGLMAEPGEEGTLELIDYAETTDHEAHTMKITLTVQLP